jgi:catalase
VVLLLLVVGGFAYACGWLAPARPTRGQAKAASQTVNDPQAGLRRTARGGCVTGWFESTGQAVPLSKAAVFRPERIPLIGRLALGGGGPLPTDEPVTGRSIAVRFLLPGGEEWRTGMNNRSLAAVSPGGVLAARLPAGAAAAPSSGKPDPARMKGFLADPPLADPPLADHPKVARPLAIIGAGGVSSGFADATFNGPGAFDFVNAAGQVTAVHWSTVPMQSFEPAGPAVEADRNVLFDDLMAILARHPLQWRLIVTAEAPSKAVTGGAFPWSGEGKQVDAGLVTIDHAEDEDGGTCAANNADPTGLPSGIGRFGDLLPSAGSASYARSLTLRTEGRDEKRPGAAAPPPVRPGGSSGARKGVTSA